MWLGQAKFFCTRCRKELTDNIQELIEQRCRTHSIDPQELSEKASEAVKAEMLQEMGEAASKSLESGFVKATALWLLELAFSPALLCDQCRAPDAGVNAVGDPGERPRLRLIQGGKTKRK